MVDMILCASFVSDTRLANHAPRRHQPLGFEKPAAAWRSEPPGPTTGTGHDSFFRIDVNAADLDRKTRLRRRCKTRRLVDGGELQILTPAEIPVDRGPSLRQIRRVLLGVIALER